MLRKKTSKLGAPPAPQKEEKKGTGVNSEYKKISVGSQIRCIQQRKSTYHRKKQHINTREKKQRGKAIQKLLTKERVEIAKKTRSTEASVLNRVETTYRFIAY